MNVICTVVIAISGIGYVQQSEHTSDPFVGPLEPMATRPLALVQNNAQGAAQYAPFVARCIPKVNELYMNLF